MKAAFVLQEVEPGLHGVLHLTALVLLPLIRLSSIPISSQMRISLSEMLSFLETKPKHAIIPPQDDEDLDNESLLDQTCSPSEKGLNKTETNTFRRDVRVAVKALVLSTIVYVCAALWVVWSVHRGTFVADADDFCMDHISLHSPVVKEVKPNWHTKIFNGSFLHENVYRQKAGPEVDAAWDALGVNYRAVVIPPEEAADTGLRHDQVHISEKYGGGYPANVEGLHHLHCLDLLRKTLHWNYEYYLAKGDGPFKNSEYIVRVHTTHCLDILRQVLMCNPDVGVLGQIWWQPKSEPHPMPFVDFNTRHRCRDYEAVRAWAEARQLPPEEEMDMASFYEMPKPGDTVYAAIP